MITQERAARIAGEILRVPADDHHHPWELIEFPQGRLIYQHGWEDYRGGVAKVIERTGQVMRYGSYVAPQLILEQYEQTRERDGRPDDRWPAFSPAETEEARQ